MTVNESAVIRNSTSGGGMIERITRRNTDMDNQYHHFSVNWPWRIVDIWDEDGASVVTIRSNYGITAGFIRVEWCQKEAREEG